jgi:hypothetical protein
MTISAAAKKATLVIRAISGIVTTGAIIGLWIWGTSGSLAEEKASIKNDIRSSNRDIVSIKRELSVLSATVEAREKARLADHDLIIQYKVRQDYIIKGISELKELIKDNQ